MGILKMIKKLVPEAIMPEYQTRFSAGCDVHALDTCTIPSGKYAIIGTGLALDPPQDTGLFQVEVRSRSGLAANHGVFVLNSPGTIDMDYRGEIKVILFNSGENSFNVSPGDRIAQLVFMPALQAAQLATKLIERGDGGFGSTGV